MAAKAALLSPASGRAALGCSSQPSTLLAPHVQLPSPRTHRHAGLLGLHRPFLTHWQTLLQEEQPGVPSSCLPSRGRRGRALGPGVLYCVLL